MADHVAGPLDSHTRLLGVPGKCVTEHVLPIMAGAYDLLPPPLYPMCPHLAPPSDPS